MFAFRVCEKRRFWAELSQLISRGTKAFKCLSVTNNGYFLEFRMVFRTFLFFFLRFSFDVFPVRFSVRAFTGVSNFLPKLLGEFPGFLRLPLTWVDFRNELST